MQVEINSKPVAIGRHLIAAHLTRAARDLHVLYIFFEATLIGGDLKISDEDTGQTWLDLNTIDPKDYFTSGLLEGIEMYLSQK